MPGWPCWIAAGVIDVRNGMILKEKLRLPDATGMARERLEGPLRDGPLTSLDVVVAPAGAGKTTLLSRVAASAQMPTGWYRITAEDSSEERLVAHLAGALRGIADVGESGSIDDVIGDLDAWSGGPGLLILDDLHEVSGTPAESALERFVSLRPKRLRLIFGSRRLPDINVPRIRLSGELREMGSDDLRFRSWEVEELFASVYQRPLRPEAAATLTRRTGGWAAGLLMFHLSTADGTVAERHQAVANLAGRSKLVRSYLTRNILAELSEDRRQFMLRTCTLGRLSGEACDALLGSNGSHRLLEELERDQLFTFADDDGVYFRYHEILQTHLEMALVEECGQSEARSWYAKSGAVLKSIGEYHAAARAFAKADDWVEVSRLVEHQDCARLGVDIAEATEVFPPNTWHSDPWLALANARRLAREGALGAAMNAYRHAASLYDESGFRRLCDQEAQVVSLWLPAPSQSSRTTGTGCSGQHWSSVLREALRIAPDFDARLAPAPGQDQRTCLGYGLAALAAGEIGWARQALTSILRGESGDPVTMIATKLALMALDVLRGELPGPNGDLSEIGSLAEREGLPWIARLCHGLQQLGLARSDDTAWRFECCAEIIAAADRSADDWGAALLSLAVAYAKLCDGIVIPVAELVEIGTRWRKLDAPVLELWFELAVACATADVAAVRRVVDNSRMLGVRAVHAVGLAALAQSVSGRDLHGMQHTMELAARSEIPLPGSQVAAGNIRLDAPTVHIVCFGGYRLEVGGCVEQLDRLRPQARSVLKILSLAPDKDHHREFLEDALWPGVGHSAACHRLQVAVSSVRMLFGGVGLEIRRRGESYRLCLPGGSVNDVRDFTEALSLASVASARGDRDGRIRLREKAMSLYTGDLLPEMTVDAVDEERQRLRRSAAAAAAALASDHLSIGNLEKALWAAQRSVDLDPVQDIPWRLLAEVNEKMGDITSAEFVRREHIRVRMELVS